jgi:hypothetical protein
MTKLRWLAVAAGAVGFTACGGDDEGVAQHARGDVERFCELSGELEQSAEEHFAQLDERVTQDDFEQAHVEFMEANEIELEDLAAAAPQEIREDVDTTLAGMRAQTGEEVEVSEAEVDAADGRLREFERENC